MTTMEAALIAVRLGQYLGSAALFGGALLLARQPTFMVESGERGVLLAASLLLALSTVAALFVQSANMAGETSPFGAPSMVVMVLTGTGFGYATVVRALATVAAMTLLGRGATRRVLWIVTGLAAVATASLAWGGHAVSDDGARGLVHLGGDILHLLAANAWIGALGVLLIMARGARSSPDTPRAERLLLALAGFAGLGTTAIAVLIVSGLSNAWFLIGVGHLDALTTTRYGELLLAKLAVFAAMLGLAGVNRWRLTPALAAAVSARHDAGGATACLTASVTLETALAVVVVLIVSWLGTLSPPGTGS
jgi:putative copper resistance protein D